MGDLRGGDDLDVDSAPPSARSSSSGVPFSESDSQEPADTVARGQTVAHFVYLRRLLRRNQREHPSQSNPAATAVGHLRWISRGRALRELDEWRHRPVSSPQLQWAAPRGPPPGPFRLALPPGSSRTADRARNLAAVRRARPLLLPQLPGRLPVPLVGDRQSDVLFFFRVLGEFLDIGAVNLAGYLLTESVHAICQVRLLCHAGYLAGAAGALRLLTRLKLDPYSQRVTVVDDLPFIDWPPSIVQARGRITWWVLVDPDPAEVGRLAAIVPRINLSPWDLERRALLPAPSFYSEINGYFGGHFHFLVQHIENSTEEDPLNFSPDLRRVNVAYHSLSCFIDTYRRTDRYKGAASLRSSLQARGPVRCGVSDYFDLFGETSRDNSDLGLIFRSLFRALNHEAGSIRGDPSEAQAEAVDRALLQARASWSFRHLDFHLHLLPSGRWLRLVVRLAYRDAHTRTPRLSRIPRSSSLPQRFPGDGLVLFNLVRPRPTGPTAFLENTFRPGIRFFINLTDYRDLTSPLSFPLDRRFLDYFFTLIGLGYSYNIASDHLLGLPAPTIDDSDGDAG